MMHGPWMFGRFFWIIPLIFLGIFLIRTLLGKRRLPGPTTQEAFPPTKEHQTAPGKTVSGKIPEALKEAGQQVLDNLDWEIRFLEKQRLEITDSKERQEIEEKLKQKREEYHATVERLEP